MKRILYVLLVALTASCNNEPENKVIDQERKDTAVTAPINSSPYTVEYDEKTQDLNLVRSAESLDKSNANDILRVINKKYDGIVLKLESIVADTVNLSIQDASKLTQEMGSAGAEAYLAEVTYSFTELAEIKVVKIDFEEGDHAMPGVYTRDYFKNVKLKR